MKLEQYIFTKGEHWFIEEFSSIEDAKQTYPDYDVELYVSTSQIYGYFA